MKHKIVIGALGFALLNLFAGCKDKTADEYQREKWQQNLSRYNSVSGSYRGLVYAKDDGRILGAMELSLRADTRVNPSNDGTTADPTPVLVGTVRFLSRSMVNLSVPNGFYDPDSSVYQGDILLPKTAPAVGSGGDSSSKSNGNDASTITINGRLTDGSLEGEILSLTYPERAGRFRLDRSAPSVEDLWRKGRPEGRDEDFSGISRTYLGTGQLGPGDLRKDIKLSVYDLPKTKVEEFVELFAPEMERRLDITINFSEFVSVGFKNTVWDPTRGTLDGSFTMLQGTGTYTAQLQCRGFFFTQTERAFSCDYWTSRSPRIHINFLAPPQNRD